MTADDKETQETYLVRSWINNDECLYNSVMEILADNDDNYTAAKTIEEYVELENPWADQNGMYVDLLNYALRRVDYVDIAESMREN
jgi:hypothetical protein